MMGVYWRTAAVLLAYLVLSWWIGTWLRLGGHDLWILRGGLALIGLLGAGFFLWFWHSSGTAVANAQPEMAPTDDVDLLVREALDQFKSPRLGQRASLAGLPVIYLLGESGSAKTSTVVHSSLDPQLLAGQAHQDEEIVPTRTANIWYTPQAVFVDVGGSLLSQAGGWVRLIRLFEPGRVAGTFGKRQRAPRAAIVCFDCDSFLQPEASVRIQATARNLSGRLQEVSRVLRISFPVYVLFTRIDRIATFLDYVRHLSKEEVSEVMGATLPIRPSQSMGPYAEEEQRRLTKAFDELFYSLAEKRTDLLARETEPDRLPGIYEFPRDLRKLRAQLVNFLVDLTRPGDLPVNPFLRGFYFSGGRTVTVDDAVLAQPQPVAAEPVVNAGATRIFSSSAPLGMPATSVRAVPSRKLPQWLFLARLFRDVILKDRVALSASVTSARGNPLRRLLPSSRA